MNKPLLFLGEAFGTNEARLGVPFVGSSGVELLKMSNEAGLLTLTPEDLACISRYWQTSKPDYIDAIWRAHPELARTNVLNLHPPGNKLDAFCGPKETGIAGYPTIIKSKYLRAEFIPQLERLADEILSLNPNLIVALGNTPVWALCGISGITKIRGTTRLSTHIAADYKVLPTYHPAAVIRQWELRPTTIADLIKANREREYPEIRRPEREIWIEPTIEDIQEFITLHITKSTLLSVDIETSGNRVTCIGLAPSPRLALVVPFDDSRKPKGSYWPDAKTEAQVWVLIKGVLEDRRIRKVFQNGLYDIAFLWRSVGVRVLGASEDTMLLHHSLQPESLKSLGFLGSIYSNESAWKTERKRTKTIKRDA